MLHAGAVGWNSTLRLVNAYGGTPFSGRLEMLWNGVWAPVGASMDTLERHIVAFLACRQLGFVGNGTAVADYPHMYGLSAPGPWFNIIMCSGNESVVQNCASNLVTGNDSLLPTVQMTLSCPAPGQRGGRSRGGLCGVTISKCARLPEGCVHCVGTTFACPQITMHVSFIAHGRG